MGEDKLMDDKPVLQSLEEWLQEAHELPLPQGMEQTTLWPAETQR